MSERLEVDLVANDAMTPSLEKAKEKTKELVESSEVLGEVIGTKLVNAFKKGGAELLGVVIAVEAVKEAFELMKEAGEDLLEGLEALYDTFGEIEDIEHVFDFRYGEDGNVVLKEMVQNATDVGEETMHAYQIAKKLAGAFDNTEGAKSLLKTVEDMRHVFGETTQSGAKSIDAATQYFDTLAGKYTASERDIKRFNSEFGRGASLQKSIADIQKKSLSEVQAELKGGLVPINDYIAAIQRLAGTDASGKVHGPGELSEELSKGNLVDQVNRVKNVWEDFKIEIAKGLFTPEVVDNIKQFADELKAWINDPETKAGIKELLDSLGKFGKTVGHDLLDSFKRLEPTLSKIPGWIAGVVDSWDTMKATFNDPVVQASLTGIEIVLGAVAAVLAVFAIALFGVGLAVYLVWEGFKYLGEGLYALYAMFADQDWAAIGAGLVKPFKEAWEWLKGLASKAFELGVDLVKGLANGIVSAVHHVIDAAKHVADSVINFFKDHFSIHSPSLVMEDVGTNVTAGFTRGLDKGAPDVQNTFESILAIPQSNAGRPTSGGDVLIQMHFDLVMPEAGTGGHLSQEGLEEVAGNFRRQADEAVRVLLSRSQLQGGI